ncbi:hypothetical protein MAMC_01160 [Methylacidimicrobium cyclopophantes]|uniref:Uncharacterized protein n=2 Tax=Methylacidimicrobium cyclopophantes TaxID=1041766 RepID=A0A5E6MAS0_9BACT|nr:hypothetical protein MAMC_01160 [Methylacidimicrobium cyclopophantes]
MPLSGDLNELPFPEILRLLRHRTGELRIGDKVTGEHFSFRFSAGKLVSASEGNGGIADTLALHSAIQRLSSEGRGSFSFEEAGVGELLGELSIPIDQILLSSLAAVRSPEGYAPHLPHPDTRFHTAVPSTPWLTEDLLAFWVSSERLLLVGTSASEIAAALGLPLPEVLLELFKLRVLGVIAPLPSRPRVLPLSVNHAASLPQLPAPPSASTQIALPEPQPESAPEVAPPSPPSSPVAAPSPATALAPVQKPAAPRRGFLARIAAGLRGILEKMYE